jgi:phage/plasmid-like protein (TIGR03299 family)
LSIATSGLLSVEGVDYWPHIIAATSCNGKRATTYKAVNTLAVCDNTLAMAMGERNGAAFKLKHTKYSAAKLADAREALRLLDLTGDAMAEQIKALCAQTVTDAQWSAFVQAIAPITDDTKAAGVTRAEREREELATLYNGDPRVEPWRGTAFGALQAANVHDLWFRGTRGAGEDAQQAKADRVISEAIAGKLAEREQANANTLQAILANA